LPGYDAIEDVPGYDAIEEKWKSGREYDTIQANCKLLFSEGKEAIL